MPIFVVNIHKKMQNHGLTSRKMSLGMKWLLLFAFMMAGFVVAVLGVTVLTAGTGQLTRGTTVAATVLQNLFVFIAPPCVVAMMAKHETPPAVALRLHRPPAWRWLLAVVVVYALSLPAMNWLVQWNEGVTLPPSLAALEKVLRASEDSAAAAVKALLAVDNAWQLLGIVGVVAVLTAVGEEMFFRAGLLGTGVDHGCRKHLMVWGVAVVFSAFHGQFYGLVPRMVLGAWLGYLMLWSGSLWVPVFAHALNNAVVVVNTYLVDQHIVQSEWLNTVGTAVPGQPPVAALLSAVATAVAVVACIKFLKQKEPIQ